MYFAHGACCDVIVRLWLRVALILSLLSVVMGMWAYVKRGIRLVMNALARAHSSGSISNWSTRLSFPWSRWSFVFQQIPIGSFFVKIEGNVIYINLAIVHLVLAEYSRGHCGIPSMRVSHKNDAFTRHSQHSTFIQKFNYKTICVGYSRSLSLYRLSILAISRSLRDKTRNMKIQ